MEEEPSDPHEQQLFAVFKSCLTKGQKLLDRNGLLCLCDKLELEESHKDAILASLKVNTEEKCISFASFRDSFLALLGKSQESFAKERNNESKSSLCKSDTICTDSFKGNKQSETMSFQQKQMNKNFDQVAGNIWSNHDSYTVEDVNKFCNRTSILSKQMVELIFEKLDLDGDGLINFDEFLHFFQSANSKLREQLSICWTSHSSHDQPKSDHCKEFIHDQTGNVVRSAIIELWDLAGVSDPNSLLADLGFTAPTINIIELSNALSSELKLHRDVPHAGGAEEYIRLLRGALILYQEEIRNINSALEQTTRERDKLRCDLSEANDRAVTLAQEVDEHQARADAARDEQIRQLELRHSESLRLVREQLQAERESGLGSMEERLVASQMDEQRARAELARAHDEIEALDNENRSHVERLADLEAANAQLSRQIRELAIAKEQVESIETKENEQVSSLMAHIKRLQTEMKTLRDQNDELTSELESVKHRDNDAKSIVSSVEARSTISDENDGNASMPTTEVSDTEDEDKSQQQQPKRSKCPSRSKSKGDNHESKRSKSVPNESDCAGGSAGDANGSNVNKLSETVQEFRNILTSAKFCSDCSRFRDEVSSLISELELYQSSFKPSPGQEKRRRPVKNLANELEAEYKIRNNRSVSLRDLDMPPSEKFEFSKRISTSDDMIHDLDDDHFDGTCVKTVQNKTTLMDFLPRKDRDVSRSRLSYLNNFDTMAQRDLLKEQEEKHAAENKKLLDRVSELEKSLDQLRSEYEQCEDYWASKLDEERELFEQEQKISDDKFSELITKMAEYEEQFGPEKSHDGRLTPIDERVCLEQQYNDLEEEFERWREEAQQELAGKEQEIEDLKAKLAKESRSNLADMSVQFPDEHMRSMYPELYSALCSPREKADVSTLTPDKVDGIQGADRVEPKIESTYQCSQCHKPQNNNDGHKDPHQNSVGPKGDQKHRKNEGKGKDHHYHHHQKSDSEFKNLLKQKEKLKQEIIKLQSLKAMNVGNMYPMIGSNEQNIFSNLCAKLYAQEQREKYLQVFCHNQQKDHEKILEGTWKQHLLEIADLKLVIQATEEKLNLQIKLNREQSDKLTQADFLTKELFVENAQLSETIKRLEQHCQILSQNRIEPTPT
ncbi:hypothetical protein QAD02_008932 [Eretmocerus hayati]|uniref:Uncharacterized protein n=1 Tax=Eretmocerus hayati TaxID=131215 RepID=A0ACC2N7U0_9HYME|nr:hypothetical protein QAD02_008932 [Eretmocerus hayati]